jgi:hypothetical protein
MNKVLRAVTFILGALMAGTLFVALSVSGGLKNDPTSPDPASGHTIQMSVRGVGTVYMTASEWSTIAPYWNAFYVCAGLLAACAVGMLLVKCYADFTEKKRSENRH